MVYDPQAKRPRPKPADAEGAPVEALLADAASTDSSAAAPVAAVGDDPPPTPAVTPDRADPPSDALLINTGLTAAVGALLTLLIARYLWLRRRTARNGA